MHEFFRLHDYSENMKVRIATFSIKGKANIWWEDLKNVREIQEEEFMCLMNSVLRPYLDMFVIVFINYLLIYSKNEEEHTEHLTTILILPRQRQLYSKLSKCSFFQKEVHYLGHVVSKEGIVVNLENIRAIMEWETPSNMDEVGLFMGLAGYYK